MDPDKTEHDADSARGAGQSLVVTHGTFPFLEPRAIVHTRGNISEPTHHGHSGKMCKVLGSSIINQIT